MGKLSNFVKSSTFLCRFGINQTAIYMLTYILLTIGGFLLVGYLILSYLTPNLPKNANQLIRQTIKEELPELIKGRAEIIDNQGVNIWYNVMEPAGEVRATVLLIMGHSATALSFPPHLWQPMLDKGYRVIRYDNRGVGLSNWMEHTGKGNRYSLEDMATDAIAILDNENIAQAHIWGVSMGGMIAQCVGLDYPQRALSLTLVMTSGYTYDPDLTIVNKTWQRQLMAGLTRYGLFKDEANRARFGLVIATLLKGEGDYEVDTKGAIQRSLYEWRKRRGGNPKVLYQHSAAIAKSGSRLERLHELEMPILILHGTKDPLVLPAHGEKLMAHLPQAKSVWIDNMGHDLPKKYISTLLKHTFEVFAQAEKSVLS